MKLKTAKPTDRKAVATFAGRVRKAPHGPCAAPERGQNCTPETRGAALRARAAHVMDLPLDYMPSAEFTRRGAAERILGPLPEAAKPRTTRQPADLPRYLASLYEVPLLTAEQERHLFRKYNFLKHRASKLRDELDPARPNARLIGEIEQLHAEAVEIKNQIIRANLRLVVSIAKKHARQDNFFDMVSDGNISLMKAVEKFDYMMGFKFSTYATWAIKKNYSRDYMVQARHADRFRTSLEESLDWTADWRSDGYQQERMQEHRAAQVDQVLDCLNEREREIIKKRFGLNYPQGQTLQQVGDDFGISKERIRQIESRALAKLRENAAPELIDAI
jgi:RNA polymerase sigma factor (sigma-70 family)